MMKLNSVHPPTPDESTDDTDINPEDRRIGTAAELLKLMQEEGVIGMWADRDDIGDTVEFARELRKRTWRRSAM